MRILSDGRMIVGGGATVYGNSNADDLVVGHTGTMHRGGISIVGASNQDARLAFSKGTSYFDSLAGYIVYQFSDNRMATYVNMSERIAIDSNGKILIGHNGLSARTSTAALEIYKGNVTNDIAIINSTADDTAGARSGNLLFCGRQSGGERTTLASVGSEHEGTADDQKGILKFRTNDGSDGDSPTERVRITSAGDVLTGKTVADLATAGSWQAANGTLTLTRDGSYPLIVNRLSSDGKLVTFYQDGTQEGNISVSGSTVSLVGAHLSRWTQLPSNATRTEILRGSVLSNIDEMCEWGDEDNEQLNRMKVSDVVGDKNVAGVFQSWDDDDDTYLNDFHCAMTGDFVIRIAQGVTVERGDLLMSAGDGTAKPQDDDIVRSKTIAKVTSTTVSTTYSDGSYCVPCVLMAC
jgi:hypothetical protein